ncbi:bile acid:sodium symporter family protein [Dietzia sp.]|uniref:bile acid:sodium symporter family protein n=1 Tax=Dietzia sp. TaxID=1871616 RepID=UPI002FD902A2
MGILAALGRGCKKLRLDWFIFSILVAVGVAALLPASGGTADVLGWVNKVGIALLFFLYGARMSPRDTLEGLKHWRLHTTVTALTFIVFPLLGLLSQAALKPLLGEGLASGVLFLTLVPSTVQSSITFVSIARGNVPAAIVSASASNLIGVVATPLLVIALMTATSGVHIDGSSIVEICVQLLLPYVLGQLLRPWVLPIMNKIGPKLGLYDKAVIVLVVYTAFSEAVSEGMFSQISWAEAGWLVLTCCVILAIVLGLTAAVGRLFHFSVADQRVVQFCGSKKSLATGMPMASVLFAGQPIGLLVLPLMVFHQIQLIVCAWLANRYGREYDAEHAAAS